MNKIITFLLLFIFAENLFSQNAPPTSIEILPGNNKMFFQTTMYRPIGKKLNYLSINTAILNYKGVGPFNEVKSANRLGFEFIKNISIFGGIQFNSGVGLIPHTGLHFLKGGPSYLVYISQAFNFRPDNSSEELAIAEFKPKISSKLKLYLRGQGIYIKSLDSHTHERSLVYLRLGLNLSKFTFGLANNFDFYGNNHIKKQNQGLFFKYDL